MSHAMDPRLQRRVQRYGWDLAAPLYERHWQALLRPAQLALLALAHLKRGQHVLDVASGTGLVSFSAAREVGLRGRVLGIDLSGQMVAAANHYAVQAGLGNVRFERMDAESLQLPDAGFDVALCALGLMYLPDPLQALREMRRVLKPGGRAVFAVWGEGARCGWSGLFPVVDAEVASEVCPLFFQLGQANALVHLCAEAGFGAIEQRRLPVTLDFNDGRHACDAAFMGGPVALAWSRFDEATRARVRLKYLESLAPWAHGDSYRVPAEFALATAIA